MRAGKGLLESSISRSTTIRDFDSLQTKQFSNRLRVRWFRRQSLRTKLLVIEKLENRYAFSVDLSSEMVDIHGNDHIVDSSGYELHVLTNLPIQADPVNPENTLNTVTPVAIGDTFRLHSNLGAKHRIFLDFDGQITSGTIWNSNFNGGRDIVTPAYDLDGNSSAFSNTELQQIQLIWERVSEDFIPFNVDVTTEDPGSGALANTGGSDTEWGIRVLIGGSSYDWFGSAAGGVAYVGSFNWSSDTPAFVFPAQLGGGAEKYTAEAISHETGHSLGLDHDGRTNPVEEYYAGQGSGATGWAPIMGNSYYQNVTQWSRGEYLYASQLQDDLSIITTQNGFSYRVDDRGNSISTAKLLKANGSSVSDWGIIERTTDEDYFSFWTDSGTIDLRVSPLDRGPNLDVFLQLFDSANNLIASSNPSDSLAASISTVVTAQNYYLKVSGTGKGDPSTNGYSRYASLGQYFISGTLVPSTKDYVAISSLKSSQVEGNSGSFAYDFTVARSGNLSITSTVDFSVTGSGSSPVDANDFLNGVIPSGTLTFAPGEDTKTLTVWINGDQTVEGDEGFTIVLSNPSGSTIVATSSADGLIVNDDVVAKAGVTVTPTSGLVTKESGTTATFSVVLNSKPNADVTIAVKSLDLTEGTVNKSSLVFTASNWNVAQVVTVQGVDDTIRDGNITYFVELSNTVSSDPNYNGMQVPDVQVTNQDDERGGRKGFGAAFNGGTNEQLVTQLFVETFANPRLLSSFSQNVFAISETSIRGESTATVVPGSPALDTNSGDRCSQDRLVGVLTRTGNSEGTESTLVAGGELAIKVRDRFFASLR